MLIALIQLKITILRALPFLERSNYGDNMSKGPKRRKYPTDIIIDTVELMSSSDQTKEKLESNMKNEIIHLASQQDSKKDFIRQFHELLRLRRDVRRFKSRQVPENLIQEIISAIELAPSVGLSEPTRLIRIQTKEIKYDIITNFEMENSRALAGYTGSKAQKYADLKLSGLKEAPVQFAVYCDVETAQGFGLGARTIPETKAYSTACAVMLMWLSASARNLGMGWVSIFNVEEMNQLLQVDPAWKFMGCLCIGWPEEQHLDPELQRYGWQERRPGGAIVITK